MTSPPNFNATTKNHKTTQEPDEFSLNAAQMAFMINIEPAAERADHADDYDFFDRLVASDEWQHLFGAMSWDQAFDRYEVMLGLS